MDHVSNKKITDAGMAFVLLSSGIGFLLNNKQLWLVSLFLLLLNMTIPKVFKYPSIFWYKFSEILGVVSSTIILTVIFYLVLFPISFFKRAVSKKDELNLKSWKNGEKSTFTNRDHTYTPEDLINPY